MLFRSGEWQYKSEYHTIDEIAGNETWKEQRDAIVVEEFMVNKLQMMMMSL